MKFFLGILLQADISQIANMILWKFSEKKI